jgi:hypothetical protein
MAEDKGIEPSALRRRSFQDCLSTMLAILHELASRKGFEPLFPSLKG